MRPKSWVFAVVMMAGCLFATGQSRRDGGYQHNGNMTDAHLNWLDQQLNLTEDQMAKLRPILMEEGQQMKGVRQETSLSWDQKQGKLKEIHKTFEPRINAVLTPEQQEKYKQLEQEAREKHEEKMKAGSVDEPH
jgi:Spy/CpxP family protein refolding chaperone